MHYLPSVFASLILLFSLGCGDVHQSQIDKIRSGETDSFFPLSTEPFDLLLADPDTAARVRQVHFTDTQFSVYDCSRIVELPGLEVVTLYCTRGTDTIIPTLSAVETVEKLVFDQTDLSDVGLAHIDGPALKELSIRCYDYQITEDAVANTLKRLTECTVDVRRQ